MTRTYAYHCRKDLPPAERLLAGLEPTDHPFDGPYDAFLFAYDDGRPVEFIGADGGEPEDQTLGRDWRWVPDALKHAYEQGRLAGAHEQRLLAGLIERATRGAAAAPAHPKPITPPSDPGRHIEHLEHRDDRTNIDINTSWRPRGG